jgi:hypothetical protein
MALCGRCQLRSYLVLLSSFRVMNKGNCSFWQCFISCTRLFTFCTRIYNLSKCSLRLTQSRLGHKLESLSEARHVSAGFLTIFHVWSARGVLSTHFCSVSCHQQPILAKDFLTQVLPAFIQSSPSLDWSLPPALLSCFVWYWEPWLCLWISSSMRLTPSVHCRKQLLQASPVVTEDPAQSGKGASVHYYSSHA